MPKKRIAGIQDDKLTALNSHKHTTTAMIGISNPPGSWKEFSEAKFLRTHGIQNTQSRNIKIRVSALKAARITNDPYTDSKNTTTQKKIIEF